MRTRTSTTLLAALLAPGPAALAAASTGQWSPVRTIAPRPAVPGAFGAAVAISEGRLWIGPSRDRDVGDGPPQVTALAIGAGFGLPTTATASVEHPSADRSAGFGLALAAAHGICVAGSPHAGCRERGCDSGQVHLLRPEHDGSWSVEEVACPDPEPASEWGGALSTDGRTLVVGAPRLDAGDRDAGAVDVYELSLGAETAVRHVARLASPHPVTSGRFGAAVAVDGEWIAVGEPGAGERWPRAGAVHLAHRVAGGWSITETLRAPAGAVGWYGASVALAGDALLVGAPIAQDPASGTACGAAVLHRRAGDRWPVNAVLRAPAGVAGDGFGLAVALSGRWAAIGAPGDDAGGRDAGAAWAVELPAMRMERILARSPNPGDGFGAGLAFGRGVGDAVAGPLEFIAVASARDPEREASPGSIDLFGLRRRTPVILAEQPTRSVPMRTAPRDHPSVAHSEGPQSRSASSIAIAADASVTVAGAHPDSAARACAASP